jgi:hypothetical protein
MAEPSPQPVDETDSDLLEPGFGTGTEGEGFEDSAGGTE